MIVLELGKAYSGEEIIRSVKKAADYVDKDTQWTSYNADEEWKLDPKTETYLPRKSGLIIYPYFKLLRIFRREPKWKPYNSWVRINPLNLTDLHTEISLVVQKLHSGNNHISNVDPGSEYFEWFRPYMTRLLTQIPELLSKTPIIAAIEG